MTEETNALFDALYALEDVRELLRQTAPKHALDAEQKKRLAEAIARARSSIDKIEGKLR